MRRVVFRLLAKGLEGVSSLELRRHNENGGKGNVILLHGWREHMLHPTLHQLALQLFEAGYDSVTAVDMKNHGVHADERERGMVYSYRHIVRELRFVVYRILLSRSRGQAPTYVIGYSLGGLIAMLLLQMSALLRPRIGGVIFISVPLRVTQNASTLVQKFIPVLKPLSGLLKRAAAHYGVQGKKAPDPDDKYYYYGPIPLCTSIEIYNAVRAANTPGKMEKLAALRNVAFIHGTSDEVAPWQDVRHALRRAVSTDFTKLSSISFPGAREYHSEDGSRVLLIYRRVGHDIFNESTRVYGDVVRILDGWSEQKFEPLFHEDKEYLLRDLADLGIFWIAEFFTSLWNARHRFLSFLRFGKHR